MAEQASILVVDDEPAVQNALSRALSLERYDVAQAVDGREALELLGTAAYEVVILDISMPHVDGLEVCRRLREGGDRTPVLMLTAREQVDDRVAGLDAGADDYLVKPFALRELLARVRALLRRASEEDEQDNALAFEDLRLDRLAHEVEQNVLVVSQDLPDDARVPLRDLLDLVGEAHRSVSPMTASSEPTIAIRSAMSDPCAQVAVACSAANDGARKCTRHGLGPPSLTT